MNTLATRQSDGVRSAAPTRPPRTAVPTGLIRSAGALPLGAILVYAAAMMTPLWSWTVADVVGDVAGAVFLAGTVLQLIAVWRTDGVGRLPGWRTVVVLAAIAASVGSVAMAMHAVNPGRTTLLFANAIWFLVMIFMLTVGVGIVAAGAWRAPLRYLPLLGHCWPAILLPAVTLLGEGPRWPVYVTFLVVTQALLALTLLVRPELTRPARRTAVPR